MAQRGRFREPASGPCDDDGMRTSWLVLLGLFAGCHAEAPVTFTAAAPAPLEVESRHQLALALTIGVGAEVEPQRWEESSSLRARVEPTASGAVVRWLERTGDEGRQLEGRSFVVDARGARPLDGEGALAGGALQQTLALARTVSGPDALQVALLQSPTRREVERREVKEAFVRLAQRALGSDAAVEVSSASLVLRAATDAVAVFEASLVASTRADAVAMTYALRGTLEVRRADTLPLSLALEGPVTVRSTEQDPDLPRVEGKGLLVVSRRLRTLGPAVDEALVTAGAGDGLAPSPRW